VQLQPQLESFLRSSATISELVSDDLMAQISIRSPLQSHIESHLQRGGSLILSGTAGSGKTHLIRVLRENSDLSRFLVVEDLASADRSEWERIGAFESPSILAGNEGALIAAARSTSSSTIYSDAVRLLHEMQVGHITRESGRFLLVDMAGADAAAGSSLDQLLNLPILHEYAHSALTERQARAWGLLGDDTVRRRVAALVAAAAAVSDSGGFTFRQVWQFVAELLLPDVDDTPWMHRVFRGRTAVSRAIQEAFPLSSLALPNTGARLWYRDFDSLTGQVSDAALDVLWDYGSTPDWQSNMVLVSVAVFVLVDSPIDLVLAAPRDLWTSLAMHMDATDLIRAINNYLTYGLRTVGVDLELWIPTDLERRTSKPEAQVSLGAAPAAGLEVRRNLIFSTTNLDNEGSLLRGTRLSLLHKPSGASLALSRDLIYALSGVRSHRVSDRSAVEFDWRLFRFLSRIATCSATPTRLDAVHLNFDQRSSRTVHFQLSDRRIVGDAH